MFSPFRGRRVEEPGAGGKVLRSRRRAVSASPYARPENSPPPPVPQSGNPKWFSGIISGAGRLISSVFRSDSGESSSSSSSDADEGDRDSSDGDENGDDYTKELQTLDETGRSYKSSAECAKGSQLASQWSERKLAIKQLLLQETFSRDESDILIKIIQSRVVDATEVVRLGEQTEVPEKTVYSDLTFLGTWRSLNRGRKFPEGLPYSSNHLNDLSLGTSLLHGYTQDLCDKAVMEAKQWLDKKKLESASKSERDFGPCTLNTDQLEDDAGSPVDIAKTYMRARPPWQSPILSSIGFKTPPTGMLLFKDETPSIIRADLSSASQDMKRSYLPPVIDDSLSLRLMSTENTPDRSMLHLDESILEHETHQTADESDPTEATVNHSDEPLSAIETLKALDASSTPENLSVELSYPDIVFSSPSQRAVEINTSTSLPSPEAPKPFGSSAIVPVNLCVEDDCPEEFPSSRGSKTFVVDHSSNGEVNTEAEMKNEVINLCSTNLIPDPEDDINVMDFKDERPARTISPQATETVLESLSISPQPSDVGLIGDGTYSPFGADASDILIIDSSQDFEETQRMEKQVDRMSIDDEFLRPEPAVGHSDARGSVKELSSIEREELALEAANSSLLSNANRPVTSSESSGEVKPDQRFSVKFDLLPESELEDAPVDPRSQEGNAQEGIPAAMVSTNGSSLQPGSSSNPWISASEEGHHLPPPSNGGEPAAASAELRQKNPPQNGTVMKSIEQMLSDNRPAARGGGRGRRVAAKSRRGRGRGK